MRILTICPTKYPYKFEKMLSSFNVTKSKSTDFVMSSHGTVTEAINDMFNYKPDYDFYHITNDDVFYETPLWDLELTKKGKISYGDDGIQAEELPTFPMIDGDIVRALGWLQMPRLNRYCGDLIWKFIGQECGILNYCPGVKITHEWEGCGDPDAHKKDMEIFANWLPQAYKDVNKVKEMLCQKKNTTQ